MKHVIGLIKRNEYTKETKESWKAAEKKDAEFAKKHSRESVKEYEINGFTIKCKKFEYDPCMKRENAYIVEVWETWDETNKTCISTDTFKTPEEGNKHFKEIKMMLDLI